MPEEKKLTVIQVAEKLDAARGTISRMCRQGKFPNAKKIESPIGDYWEIPESDLLGIEIKMGRPKKD